MEYLPGDFSFVSDIHLKNALTHDYNNINSFGTEAWDALKTNSTGTSTGTSTLDFGILKKINEGIYEHHSGCSYGITMRILEYIAKNGWNQYYTLEYQKIG